MTNNKQTKTAGKPAKQKTFCKACGKETKYGNEFCTPEEGREFNEKEVKNGRKSK